MSHSTSGHANGSHAYRVKACNTDSAHHKTCSTYSASRSVYVARPPGKPSASVSPGSVTAGTPYTLSWNTPSGHIAEYQIEVSRNSSFSGANPMSEGTRHSVSLPTDYEPGTYYPKTVYNRVRACNGTSSHPTAACGAWSSAVSVGEFCKPAIGRPYGLKPQMMHCAGDPWSIKGAYDGTGDAASKSAPRSSHGSHGEQRREAAAKPAGAVELQARASSPARPAPARLAAAGATGVFLGVTPAVVSAPAVGEAIRRDNRTQTDRDNAAQAANAAISRDSHARRAVASNAGKALNRQMPMLSRATPRYAPPVYRAWRHWRLQPAAYRPETTSGAYRLTVTYHYDASGALAEVTGPNNTVYWQARARDARGQPTAIQLGNGVVTVNTYDPATGALLSRESGPGGYATVQSIHYQYDKLGNVTARTDAIQGLTDTFTYDSLNRLTNSTLTAHGTTKTGLTVTYNAIGNIKTQSGVGTYTYSAHHPHAVKSISGPTDTAYTYDADGNTLTGHNTTYSWTAFNKPWRIGANGAESQFWYAPDRARYKHVTTQGGVTTTTRTIGGLFRIISEQGGATLYRHNIIAAGKTIAIYTNTSAGSERIRYLHHNAQGSVTAVTDGMGKIVTRMSYTAFGERRDPITGQGAPKPPNTIAADRAQTYRGYTGQEELDAVGLIHYNGRVYDPRVGRFISADPHIQAPYRGQSLNRYAYAWNNPMTLTDPTGFTASNGSDHCNQSDDTDSDCSQDDKKQDWWDQLSVRQKIRIMKMRHRGKTFGVVVAYSDGTRQYIGFYNGTQNTRFSWLTGRGLSGNPGSYASLTRGQRSELWGYFVGNYAEIAAQWNNTSLHSISPTTIWKAIKKDLVGVAKSLGVTALKDAYEFHAWQSEVMAYKMGVRSFKAYRAHPSVGSWSAQKYRDWSLVHWRLYDFGGTPNKTVDFYYWSNGKNDLRPPDCFIWSVCQ